MKPIAFIFLVLVLASSTTELKGQDNTNSAELEDATNRFHSTDLSESERKQWLEGELGHYPIMEEDDEELKLLKKRTNLAWLELEGVNSPHVDPMYMLTGPYRRVIKAESELSLRMPIKLAKKLETILESVEEVEALIRANVEAGRQPLSDQIQASYFTIDVKLLLLRAKRTEHEKKEGIKK